ncbi:hypothetical protein SAXI111661_11125 [Saccharomonospora xinjiangensis]
MIGVLEPATGHRQVHPRRLEDGGDEVGDPAFRTVLLGVVRPVPRCVPQGEQPGPRRNAQRRPGEPRLRSPLRRVAVPAKGLVQLTTIVEAERPVVPGAKFDVERVRRLRLPFGLAQELSRDLDVAPDVGDHALDGECRRVRGFGACRLRRLGRHPCAALGVVEAADPAQHLGARGEHPGLLPARLAVGDQVPRLVDGLDGLVVGALQRHQCLGEPAPDRRLPRGGAPVHAAHPFPRERDRALGFSRPRGQLRGRQQQRDLVAVPRSLLGPHRVPDLQSLLHVPQRRAGSAEFFRLVRRAHQRGQRRRQVPATQTVIGEPGIATPMRRQCADAGRVRGVHAGPFARQQVVVHGLPQQRVPEPVMTVIDHEDVVMDGLPQRLLHVDRPDSCHLGDGRVRHVRARHRHRAQHPPRLLREAFQPRQQHIGEAVRHVVGRRSRGQHLLGEERVALAAAHEPVEHIGRQWPVRERRQERPGLVVGHRRDVHSLDGRRARQLRQQWPQRVPPVHLLGPVTRDHEQPLSPESADEERQQVAGRAVGPVDVLHDQHHGAVPRQIAQHSQHGVEQPQLAEVVFGPDPANVLFGRRRPHQRLPAARNGRRLRDQGGQGAPRRDGARHVRIAGRGE